MPAYQLHLHVPYFTNSGLKMRYTMKYRTYALLLKETHIEMEMVNTANGISLGKAVHK